MPKIPALKPRPYQLNPPAPHESDVCSQCRQRFVWSESPSGRCYWCEIGRDEHKAVEAAFASRRNPVKAKKERNR